MGWLGDDWENLLINIWEYKDYIISKINIIDIIYEKGLVTESINTGTFTHRLKCPLHGDGEERTPSLFVSSKTNSFKCFSCDKIGDVIDFVSLMNRIPSTVALEQLGKKIGLIDGDGYVNNNINCVAPKEKKTITPYLFQISELLRNQIYIIKNSNNFEEKIKKLEKIFKKVDTYLLDIDIYECDKIESLLSSLKKKLGDNL